MSRIAVKPLVRRIAAVMGSQVAKTEWLLNVQGHKLDTDPAPVMYVGPTKSNIDKVIEPRAAALLKSCVSLKAKTATGRRVAKLAKEVAGVSWRFAWAGSPTELASQPVHTVAVDEVDRMQPIPGEGDPVEITGARGATFPDSRQLIASSPTAGSVDTFVHPQTGIEHWRLADGDEVASPVWRLWQEGTRHEWAVPCPHCGEFFVPRFRLLTWPKDSTPQEAQRKAFLACPRSGCVIEESSKHWMNSRGVFLAPGQRVEGFDRSADGVPEQSVFGIPGTNGAVVGELEQNDTFSFWVSGLVSPWVTFGQRAAAWLRASLSGDQERIRAVLNTGFGELYRTSGQAPPWEGVRDACAADYCDGDVPAGVQVLYAGLDVQGDRIEFVVRGFGFAFESWRIEAGELYGSTETAAGEAFSKADELLARKFDGHAIKALAIDSGYRSQAVYEWARKHGIRVFVTKGRDGPKRIYSSTDVETKRNGKRVPSGLKLWTLDDKHFKAWVQDRWAWPRGQAGAWRLPSRGPNDEPDVPGMDDYCKQLIAEQRMRLPSGRVQWIRVSKENHKLDCEAMLAFLAHVDGVRNLKPLVGGRPKVVQRQAQRRVVRNPGVQV